MLKCGVKNGCMCPYIFRPGSALQYSTETTVHVEEYFWLAEWNIKSLQVWEGMAWVFGYVLSREAPVVLHVLKMSRVILSLGERSACSVREAAWQASTVAGNHVCIQTQILALLHDPEPHDLGEVASLFGPCWLIHKMGLNVVFRFVVRINIPTRSALLIVNTP